MRKHSKLHFLGEGCSWMRLEHSGIRPSTSPCLRATGSQNSGHRKCLQFTWPPRNNNSGRLPTVSGDLLELWLQGMKAFTISKPCLVPTTVLDHHPRGLEQSQRAVDCLMLWKLTRVGDVGMDMALATRARIECLSCHRCHLFRTAERTWEKTSRNVKCLPYCK